VADDKPALRVAVAGGGLGGLCLAQGLAGAGLDVTVYERDESLTARRQGYRLHLDSRAGKALGATLPPPLYALFAATCGLPSERTTVLSERLRLLHSEPATASNGGDPFAPESLSTSAHRQTLREILASGLAGRIRFGADVTGFDADADGVRVRLADGSRAEADVLVAADGVGSPVRRQYLPAAEVTDTGARCVYGRTPLTSEALRLLPEPTRTGFTAIVGRSEGMALAPMRFRTRPDEAARRSGLGIELTPVGDYLIWAVSAQLDRWPVSDEQLDAMGPGDLRDLALTMIKSWDRSIRALVQQAEPEACFPVRIQSAAPVAPWTPTRVTLLGDAIHAMSPARGSGANTALRDAALLSQELTAAARGEKDLLAAIGDYERAMLDYGFEAVRVSERAEVAALARRRSVMFWIVNHMPGGRATVRA
jgi:2-polyprenyl-6-methoxyphenol hydroxylase-like FAD-dependent oxidoreductase